MPNTQPDQEQLVCSVIGLKPTFSQVLLFTARSKSGFDSTSLRTEVLGIISGICMHLVGDAENAVLLDSDLLLSLINAAGITGVRSEHLTGGTSTCPLSGSLDVYVSELY